MLPIDVYKQIVAKNGPTTLACTGTSYTDTHTYGAYCTALNNCLWYPKVCERNWRKEMPSIRQFVACLLLLLLLFSFVGVVVTVTHTHTHINTRTRSRHSSSYISIPSTFVKLRPARENKTKQTSRNTTRKTRGRNYWLLCNVPGAKLCGVFSPSVSRLLWQSCRAKLSTIQLAVSPRAWSKKKPTTTRRMRNVSLVVGKLQRFERFN